MENRKEQILIRITGKDRTGLTASIMEILSCHDAQILDIGQADIHSSLSLGILIRIDDTYSGQVMKELLFKATELGVNIGFEPVPDDEYEEWAGRQGKNRYILTVIGRSLSARQIHAVSEVIAHQGLNIDSIKRLTGRLSIMHPERNVRSCIEFSLRGTPLDKKAMQADLMRLHVQRPAVLETTALGAALLAGLGVGLYASLDETAQGWHVADTFSPALPEDRQQALLSGWQQAVGRTLTAKEKTP